MTTKHFTHLSILLGLVLAGCNDAGPGLGITPGSGPGASPGSELSSDCGEGSWIGGTAEVCDGVLTYRDYVYDDYGADTDPVYNSPIGSLSPVAGDATYPAGSENTADIVKLTVEADGTDLVITAELNALFAADSTILAVAIDTDNDPETGGGNWADDTYDLGVTSTGWEVLHFFDTGDPAANTIGGTIPKPETPTWRIQAVAAQSDGTVMNVAFRGTDEEATGLTADGPFSGTFWEDRQAAALAAGDISEFGHIVNASDLSSGVNRFATIEPGLHQRVYVSDYTLPPGEGISVDGVPGRHGDTGNPCEQYFHFVGKYQPYGIYIPAAPGPHGVQLAMHGCEANHASLVNNTGMQGRFGDDLNRIIVVPLGRGPVGWYSDISERDVLDVLVDVVTQYDVDEDRIFSGGYSMGGYGTLRMAGLYPHFFAGAVNWVGFTGDLFNTPIPGNPLPGQELCDPVTGTFCTGGSSAGAVGNVIDFIGNLRHVPTANLYAGEDELVHASTALALEQAFEAATALPYIFYFHPVADHLTFAVLDDWAKEAAWSADFVRVSDPAHVTYRTDPSLAFPEYGIAHDRAYWISGIAARGEGYVDVDLKSFGCGGTEFALPEAVAQNAGEDPVPWVSTERVREETPAEIEQDNRISGTLGNVAELTIDLEGACLGSGTVTYEITSDGETSLKLSDDRVVTLSDGDNEGAL